MKNFRGTVYAILGRMMISLLFSVACLECAFSDELKQNPVYCFKVVVKEPLTFYGNPGDVFTLYDGSRWKVLAGTQYEYVPLPYKDGLVCPEVERLIIANKVMKVSKLN
jgi:hypothetical protein